MRIPLQKTIYLKTLVVSITLLLGFASCDNNINETIEDDNENNISLSPYINENQTTTRMSGTNFEANDEIGVYAVAYQNNNTQEGDIINSYAPNVKHVYNASEWAIPSNGRLPWASSNTKVVLYAYYPYNASLTATNSKNYQFSINSDQSTKASLTGSDFLWAKSNAATPTKNKIPLSFTHQMSKIIINIKSTKDFTNEEISQFQVNLLNLVNDVKIDLSTGSVSIQSGATVSDITPYKRSNPTNGYNITFEAIVPPQDVALSTDLMSIKSAEGIIPHIYKAENNLTFNSGKQYTFNINISRIGISVSTDEIEDWITTPDTDGNINKPVKKAVDISNIDWNLSRVYKVMDKGIQVAEITKEYLFNGVIDAQAIVVYPIDRTGVADITKGLVAQVMKTALDNNREYNPNNTQSIHGGYALWNNGQLLYVAGTEPLINSIQVDKQDISKAGLDVVYTLTLEPDLLTDIDNNEYGIVKIGAQYWMRENLKTEHYKNGVSAEVYYYDNSLVNKASLGGLYTWHTTTNSNGLAPAGWHIPSQAEFTTLANYASGSTSITAGARKLKAMRMWPTLGNTNNLTGFEALPAGRRTSSGSFTELNSYGQWWTNAASSSTNGMRVWLGNAATDFVFYALSKDYTQSVRCVKD